MNGSEAKIEIFTPFGEAFELMKKILFQPFDLGKWCVIGFAAFLSHLSGGGFNFRFNPGSNWWNAARGSPTGQFPGWAIALIIVGAIVAFAVALVLLWIGARGRFTFIDCVVHNRGAIVEPWKEYRKEGNSLFLFTLLVGLIFAVLIIAGTVPAVLSMRGYHEGVPVGLIVDLAIFVPLFVTLLLAWVFTAHFLTPLMYRHRCKALTALRRVISLVDGNPGPIVLYCLFCLVLGLVLIFPIMFLMCVTCCIVAIPYVGTVILLPMHVFFQGFLLLFLRQFGSDYDAWAGITQAPPPLPASTLPIPPSPPPM